MHIEYTHMLYSSTARTMLLFHEDTCAHKKQGCTTSFNILTCQTQDLNMSLLLKRYLTFYENKGKILLINVFDAKRISKIFTRTYSISFQLKITYPPITYELVGLGIQVCSGSELLVIVRDKIMFINIQVNQLSRKLTTVTYCNSGLY